MTDSLTRPGVGLSAAGAVTEFVLNQIETDLRDPWISIERESQLLERQRVIQQYASGVSPDPIIRDLAAVRRWAADYAFHPGYRSEWAR